MLLFVRPLLLLCLLFLGLLSTTARAQPDNQRNRSPTNSHIILGDTSSFPTMRAENVKLRKTLQSKPGNDSLWMQLAYNLFDLTDYPTALEALNRAIALDTTRYDYYYQRASAHDRLRQFSEAYADYDKAIALNPNFEYSWMDRGILLDELQLFSRAADDLRHALQLKPNWAPALMSLGVVFDDQRNYDSAMYYYRAAAKADTAMYKAWNNIGSIQNKQEQYQQAIQSFTKALAIWPGYTFALTNRAQARYMTNDKDGACADLREAIRLGRVDMQSGYDQYCR